MSLITIATVSVALTIVCSGGEAMGCVKASIIDSTSLSSGGIVLGSIRVL